MDHYREISAKLDQDADALATRASGYRMAGEGELARMALGAAISLRQSSDWLRFMRDAEDRARDIRDAA